MPRIVQIALPPEQTEALIGEIKQLDGLIGLTVQRGVSLLPPGDVISADLTTHALHELARLLDRHGIGRGAGNSIRTTQPLGIISPRHIQALRQDPSDALWEEMEATVVHESNMSISGLLLMAFSGIVAAVGISTDALHLVIGAMVIAPGFEPISRIALGAVSGGGAFRRGLADTAKAYLVLAFAAFATGLILPTMGVPVPGGKGDYLPAGILSAYWSSITAPALLVSAVASATGGLLIAVNRSVLTAGVMIALALIPAATLTGMALSAGDFDLFARSLLRWVIEVTLVGGFSALIFLWKRTSLHRRSGSM